MAGFWWSKFVNELISWSLIQWFVIITMILFIFFTIIYQLRATLLFLPVWKIVDYSCNVIRFELIDNAI